MKGFLNHLMISLRLTYRNKQALIVSYIYPLAFLFMFGSLLSGTQNPLEEFLGQLLTMTALGASCFGLPITLVTERERGIWRRYRLVPLTTGWFVASTLLGRFVVVITSALLQIALAIKIYHMPLPLHPVELMVAFTFACFALMGVGLVIATMANNTASVQAMAQSIFLPMMVLGGVGIPLWLPNLPKWMPHVAAFLPGRYAVEALQACATNVGGLEQKLFHLLALALFGGACCLIASKLFRWETQQKLGASAKWWLLLAILPWAAVGLAAEYLGLAKLSH